MQILWLLFVVCLQILQLGDSPKMGFLFKDGGVLCGGDAIEACLKPFFRFSKTGLGGFDLIY
ncbi:hypothetical protein MANES_04G089050v8 [Manihot esculenta]|uniref:Uncharacterized protein n=1 Tax=Manihot esculenta TaxID=3983 RepID=A0ACB7HUM0_MANES|nr:hypothetical protein MANES_04G089050v8 [Manihot esculenta]